jgi:hypothetical protein
MKNPGLMILGITNPHCRLEKQHEVGIMSGAYLV